MLRNMKTMKTGKRPPLKDIRQNRGTPTKGSKLVRKYQRTLNAISKGRYRKHKSLSVHEDELPQQWRLQPYVRLTRYDDISRAKCEEKVRPIEVDVTAEEQLATARCVISSLMIYPNMLGHDDFHCLRSLLRDFGVKYTWDTVELQVPLEASTTNTSLINVNPPLPSSDIPLLFPAVFIRDMVVDPIQKVARIRQYSLMPYMCQAIRSLVNSIHKTPKILYDESHTFLYEFMVRFGVKPKDIEEYVEESSMKSSTHNHLLPTKNCSKLKKLGKKIKSKE